MLDSLCNTKLFVEITPNSTIWQTLTPCLSFVALPTISNICLAPFCALIIFLIGRFSNTQSRLEWNRFSVLKLLFTSAHTLLALAHIVYAFWIIDNSVLPENGTSALSSAVFSVSVLMSYLMCIHDGIISSGWLHFTWFCRLLLLVPGFVSLVHGDDPHFIFMNKQPYLCLVVVHSGYFCCSLFMVGALCVADRYPRHYEPLDYMGKPICPEGRSSALSLFFMWYANSLVIKGLRRSDLTSDDLWALELTNRASYLMSRFHKTTQDGEVVQVNTLWKLFWRFACTTKADLIRSIIIVIILSFMRFGSVMFLKLVVDAVQRSLPLWYPITVLVLMIMFGLTLNLFYAKRDFVSSKSYMNVRTILIAELTNKVMRLSPSARGRFSCGEVMNVVTTDVNRIRMFWFQLRDFVYCPLLLGLALVGSFYVIGWNTCYGILALCVIIGFNYYVSARMAHYEHLQMKFKDQRLKLINDILSGIRALKLYAWEPSMQKMVAEIRAKEVETLRIVFILDGLTTVSFQFGPIVAIFFSFYGYVVVDGNRLTPEVAFMSLMFFMMLRYAIYQLPQVITSTVKAYISGRRIVRLLNEQEHQPSYICREDLPPGETSVVVFENCSFSWDSSPGKEVTTPVINLQHINLRVTKGELVGVVGRVGAGKSSLLSAIVGEIECIDQDDIRVYAKSIGYVPQQAWIQNKTLKGNILFGKPFNESYYRKTVEACALLDDLKLLKAGDLTEIGERGINLSGGQKARVSLARAVYQQADLYVLDDVLSAVDSHVGKQIFENVIGPNGLLRNTTRIFALNSLAFLKDCDRIVVMNEGMIDDIGTFDNLVKKNSGPFADLMREYITKQSKKQETVYLDGEPEPTDEVVIEEIIQDDEQSNVALSADSIAAFKKAAAASVIHRRQISRISTSSQRRDSESSSAGVLPPGLTANSPPSTLEMGRLMEDERLAEGIVPRKVYVTYMRVFGIWMCIGFFVSLFGGSIFEAFSNVWLAQWSSEESGTAPSKHNISTTASLLVFGFFGFGNSICIGISSIFLAIGAYYASISFHDKVIHSLLRSPMAFFDRTPLGRIINRLSTDIDRIDENVPFTISFAFILLADAFNSIVAIVIVIPWLIAVIVPLFLSFIFATYYFNKASVQFRRISSKSWSKCCSFVQDVYMGADSIRVYDVVRSFAEKTNLVTDHNCEGTYIEFVSNRWIQVQMDILTEFAIFLFILMAILLGSANLITIGALALVINSSLSFSGFLGEISRNWREVEVQVVGVERVQEYIDNKHEALWRLPNVKLKQPWPTVGRVVFNHFYLRYRADCDFVLNDLCFEIPGGTRVGIVGRTGAGKSSITMALFRVVEPASGSIFIDDVDITKIGLHDLREVLTIIPQDPVLFCSTLRSNLDPFKRYTDEEIWDALEKAHLKEFVEGFEKKLLHEIAESGSNLSLGQRQLVCLARAILRKTTRILVLDEATAAVDPETDRLIQLSIRNYFQHCTVLTIAHRLNTILDYNRILVMDAGRAVEFDTPQALLQQPNSLFSSLVKHAGMSLESAIEAINGNPVLLLKSDETQKDTKHSRLKSVGVEPPANVGSALSHAQMATANSMSTTTARESSTTEPFSSPSKKHGN